MIKTLRIILLLVIVADITAQNLPSKSEILTDLQKVNQFYMSEHPETESITSLKTTWLIGSYFNGHMALFNLHPTKEGIRYALQWGVNNSWNLGDTRQEADNQCVGQAFMDIFCAYGAKDDYMLSKVGASVSALVDRSASDDWDWIDALYMAMPVLTRYGVWNNDARYFDKLYALYYSTKVTQGLYNPLVGLWYRDRNYDPPYQTPGGEDCHWSRGNGWVFGAHVRTLMYLPEDDSHRQEYIDVFKTMSATLKEVQRSDGFWNVSLADPTDYPGPETSGTAFFTYGIAWGINNGFLDRETYLPTVIKAWNGLVLKALDSNGRIGYVQGVGLAPHSSQPVTFDSSRDYGEGNFLLAGTEVIKLAAGEMPVPPDFFVKDVEMINPSTLKVSFFEAAEKNSVENISNYLINKGVSIESANIAEDNMSCALTLSNMNNGAHVISFENLRSVSGKTIAAGSGKYFMVTQDEPTFIDLNATEHVELFVHPNPVHQNYIHIELTSAKGSEVSIQLFDVYGKLCYSKNCALNNACLHQKIQIPNASKGLYVLNVRGVGFSLNRKLVVN